MTVEGGPSAPRRLTSRMRSLMSPTMRRTTCLLRGSGDRLASLFQLLANGQRRRAGSSTVRAGAWPSATNPRRGGSRHATVRSRRAACPCPEGSRTRHAPSRRGSAVRSTTPSWPRWLATPPATASRSSSSPADAAEDDGDSFVRIDRARSRPSGRQGRPCRCATRRCPVVARPSSLRVGTCSSVATIGDPLPSPIARTTGIQS